ncbi:MAG: hypothetical protein DMF84_18225 [Acidobacteria bacterium]|nr:MAG: hypothetical protein DMF84_18225 [Acidobacteriota bacterium]
MRVGTPFAALALCVSVVVNTRDSASPAQDTIGRSANTIVDPRDYQDLRWRNVGPTRGGRVTAVAGVRSQPCTFYMGSTGGGVFKTDTCGERWTPISDGQIADGSIGSIDVSESNPDVIYVGTGSAAIRSNVIIGRGVYKSIDAGRTWRFAGLTWIAVRAEPGARHLQDHGWRHDLAQSALRQQRDRRPRPRDQHVEPRRDLRGHVQRFP